MQILIFFTILIFILYYSLFSKIYKSSYIEENYENKNNKNNKSKVNPCTDFLSDKDYLIHMIPHHQVAIEMSERLLMYTNNSYLMDFCRKLILDQQGEIYLMNNMLLNKSNYRSELLN